MVEFIFNSIDKNDLRKQYNETFYEFISFFNKYISFLAIIILLLFIYLDLKLLYLPSDKILIFRSIPIVVIFLLIITNFMIKNKKHIIFMILYNLFLVSLMVMMYGLSLSLKFYSNSEESMLTVYTVIFLLCNARYISLSLIYFISISVYILLQNMLDIGVNPGISNHFTVMLLFVIISFYQNRLKFKEFSSKKQLLFEKDKFRKLLESILPEWIITKLEKKGKAEPRLYENVTVVFTDFVGFTGFSDTYSPEKLINELDSIFSAFDKIIAKYNLQKIKTIGDSYMFVGGIPGNSESHAVDCVKASIEICDYMKNKQILENNNDFWNIRIGMNSGKVIAGIIGEKFFTYDIWGRTVNFASRVESTGESGKINIAESTYNFVKDKFNCKYRGKISAKGIGDVDMYFIE